MNFKLFTLALISLSLFSCMGNQSKTEPTIQETLKKADLLADVPFRNLPLVDSTSFDDFDGENKLSEKLVSKLHLKDIDPDYENFHSRYRLALSEGVDAVVITLAAENEMKTFLITYTKEDYKIIDKLMISYDEIAESAFYSVGKLTTNEITVTNFNYMDEEPIIEIKKYRIDKSGKFIEK